MRDIYLLQMSRAFHSRIIVNFIPFLHIFYTIWLTVKHFYISSQLFSTSYVITKMDMKLIGYRGAWSCNFSFEYCVTFPSHTHARARTNQRYLEWRINHLRVERPKMLLQALNPELMLVILFWGCEALELVISNQPHPKVTWRQINHSPQ